MDKANSLKGRILSAVFGMLAAAALAVGFSATSAAALTAYADETRTVSIASALISGDDVVLGITATSLPASDDGYYYIYADEVYEDGTAGEIVATTAVSASTTVSFPLNFNTADSNLSRKFLVCVMQGGVMTQVSDEHYITNPEAASSYSSARYDSGIKGLFVDPTRCLSGELQDLGVEQVAYNIYLGDIVGESTDPVWYPTTYFEYDGETYAFDTYMLTCYDGLFVQFQLMGLEVTVNVINNLTEDAIDLIHPLGRDGTSVPCYAFNTTDYQGVKHLEAIAYFLGQRYDGTQGYGQVDNWVIGNEVNARSEQFYMSNTSQDYNVSEYHKAFRIFYNGLRAANGSVMVYTSLDQQWNRLSNSGSYYTRSYLDAFNTAILREGNIEYGVSIHPYNSPLYDPYTWRGYATWVGNDVTTPYLTMQNIFVFIDYMNQSEFLYNGECRSIVLSEIGFTSYYGDDLQCASIVYAYLQTEYYDDIDGFLMYREIDSQYEITNSNIAQGLVDTSGNLKPAYAYYKAMGTSDEQTYIDLASSITGYNIESLIGSRNPLTR